LTLPREEAVEGILRLAVLATLRKDSILRLRYTLIVLALLTGTTARAQSPEADRAPGAAPVPTPEGGFLVPDTPDDALDAAAVDDRRFSFKLGVAALVDYTWFEQDDASIAQVGKLGDTGEVRDARVTARGELRMLGGWRYQLTGQYKGFDREPTDTGDWTATDVSLAHDFAFGTLAFGKLKQTFVYEMVGDAANLPQSERLLTPLFKSRDLGVRLQDGFHDDRASWAVGLYDQDGTQATARLTALPVWQDEGRRYLHVALDLRYNGDDDGTLRFSGRPESNVTPLYVDTGKIAAEHAWHTGLEAVWAEGPYTVGVEVAQASVAAPASGDPTFTGWYAVGSWTVTGGGPRPYDRTVRYARRMPVAHRRGEIELVARVGRVDLDDAAVSGGTLDKWYLGANWWATKRWKASLGYGNAGLERFGLDGNTKMLLARLQWIY
jgi:phosphate-selective porin